MKRTKEMFDRLKFASDARLEGKEWKEIAAVLGVSVHRAIVLAQTYRRVMNHPSRQLGILPYTIEAETNEDRSRKSAQG